MTNKQLKALREKHGVSQLRIANLTKISRYRLQMFEYGYGVLSEVEIESLEKLFNKEKNNAH